VFFVLKKSGFAAFTEDYHFARAQSDAPAHTRLGVAECEAGSVTINVLRTTKRAA
jgi:hypothetical protein